VTEGIVLRSTSPEDTRAIGAALAEALRPGDVVSLAGELGAGKTCLVQGLARALGVEERVTSPTFLLVKQYDAAIPVVHCDVYRLDRVAELADLGDDVLAPDVLTLIEWGDAVEPALPTGRLDVELTFAGDEAAPRIVRLVPRGDFSARRDELEAALGTWREDA
jgi:tRNA threonylcarbamoyladenosine biosynthesis protein TsaE